MGVMTWIKNKMVSPSNMIDITALVSLATGFGIFMTVLFKTFALSQLDVPFLVALSVIEVGPTDFVVAFLVSLLCLALGLGFNLLITRSSLRVKMVILILYIASAIVLGVVFSQIMYEIITLMVLVLAYTLMMILFTWVIKKQPKEETSQILLGNQPSYKLVVLTVELLITLTIVACSFLFAVDAYHIMPMTRYTADDMIVLSYFNGNYLVADYSLTPNGAVNRVSIDISSLRIISTEDRSLGFIHKATFSR